MALSIANQVRLRQADAWMYQQTVPRVNQFRTFADRSFGGAAAHGLRRAAHQFAFGLGEASGMKYISGGLRHYRSAARGYFRFPTASSNPAWDKYFEAIHPELRVSAARRFTHSAMKTAGSASKVLLHGLAPATILHFAAQDEMGFGVGLAKETAAWGTFMAGGSIGMQMGGWASARTGAAVGGGIERAGVWAIGKIPGVKKIAATGIGKALGKAAGATLGGPLGFIFGAMTLMEATRWGVGYALHTLPAFAKQFRADMAGGYGGDYTDSVGAITMRQRSLQAIGRSHMNARSALGQEASLMHV